MTERHTTSKTFPRLLHISGQFALAVVAAVLLLAGCSSVPGIDTSKPVDPDLVISLVEQRNAQLKTLKAYGRISIDTPEMSNTAGLVIKALKPDSLYLEIRGPFGMTLAKGLVTSSEFTFYDSWKNQILNGETTADNMRRILRMRIEFRSILEILTGTMGFSQAPADASRNGKVVDGDYVLTYTAATETSEYLIDLDYMAVTLYTRRDAEGAVLEEHRFGDFRKRS